MAPRHPAQSTGSRGTLSARQWLDIRQAARISRSEGVTITWRRDGSMVISPCAPLKDSTQTAGSRQHGHERRQETTRDTNISEPMDTAGDDNSMSKKQQRDAKRAEANRALKASPSMARWQLLAKRLLWTARKATCNTVWTAWMRSRTPEARLEARRRVRDVLWREWTRPQIEPPPSPSLPPGCRALPAGLKVLGARSLRDEYILARARAFTNHPSIRSLHACGLSKALWSWMGFQREMDFDRTHKAARSPETAGLSTPTSARGRKKSRGGKKS
jgi:hypothetical protein